MNGEFRVQVASTPPRSNAEIERDIVECMQRLTALVREKVVAGLNLRVVAVEDVDPSIPAVDDGVQSKPELRSA